MKLKILKTLIATSWISTIAWSQETVVINEQILIKMSQKQEAPQHRQSRVKVLTSQHQLSQYYETYGSQLSISSSYEDTNEQPQIPGTVTLAPIFTSSASLSKKLPLGMTGQLISSTYQQSSTNGLIDKQTTSTVKAQVSVDLWKNFLGKLDQEQLGTLNQEYHYTRAKQRLDQKNFEIDVRKIYWNLVANIEAQKKAKDLLLSSQRQLTEVTSKHQASVARDSDLARMKAQVSSRKVVIRSLQLQQTNLEEQLRLLLPELQSKLIRVEPVDISKTMTQITDCTMVLSNQSEDYLAESSYAQIFSALDQKFQHQTNLNRRYTNPTLKLNTSYRISTQEDRIDSSWSHLHDRNYTGYSVGLELSVPVGKSARRTQKVRHQLNKQSYLAERSQIEATLKARRKAVVDQINLLMMSMHEQQANTNYLQESKVANAKLYKQARITLLELIQEQDALLDSHLKEIDAYLLITNYLLDYFKLYSQTQCAFNA